MQSRQVACRFIHAVSVARQAESAQRLAKLREAEAAAADREGVRDALRKQACFPITYEYNVLFYEA